ncbi:phenylalanine--tRNA ligase subunit beta [Balneolales bacterium ANBcel1]|nr:phenylalanine--tRNA ligase subunit beta [Balneolales bacterium ANBcel1]
MKISYNWLSRYLSEIPDPAETAERLTLTGLEVEEIEETGADLSGIVVGEVLEVKPHPDADRLVVCTVDIGDDGISQIVCGAPNVAAGQKVPVATVGSVLPKPLPDGKPFKIRKAKIRGQKSAGMICAEDELGLGDDHSGIMVLDPSIKAGTPFSEVAGVEKDSVYEIGLTPNRPDATCHLGVARDLAAATGAALKKPLENLPHISAPLPPDTIRIVDTDKCHRYVGILVRGANVDESPQWLKESLLAIGLRPVNNVVDITNFVLQELGQPLHAFDYRHLAGGIIEVRSFENDRKFTTLDDVERTVPAGSLFICDAEKPVALAGVMGGLNSEIESESSDILIESAWFEPTGIRKTARQLALQTDSSYRFERGVDPNLTRNAALRCAQLIIEVCGGTIEGMEDVHPVKTEPLEVELRHDRLNRLLGMEIDPDVAVTLLERLEIAVSSERAEPLTWKCRVPTFRPDITTEIDLIEEVARIYDYNNIPDPEHIAIAQPEPIPYGETFRENIRRAAVSAGLKEIYSNSLLPEQLLDPLGGEAVVVPTLNPITKDQALLRTSLKYGFLRSAAYNFNRNAAGVRFFEIGNVFRRAENGGTWIEGIHESTHIHIGVAGQASPEHWKTDARAFDLFDLKALVNAMLSKLGIGHLTRWESADNRLLLVANNPAGTSNGQGGSAGSSGNIADRSVSPPSSADDNIIGILEAVDSEWKKRTEVETAAFSAELNIGKLELIARQAGQRIYKPVSRFPAFEFDLALVVDKSVAAGDLERRMHDIAGKILKTSEVFDVFEGGSLEKHQKSIAFRLMFQDYEKTLTINDIDPVIRKILKKLDEDFSAKLRS